MERFIMKVNVTLGHNRKNITVLALFIGFLLFLPMVIHAQQLVTITFNLGPSVPYSEGGLIFGGSPRPEGVFFLGGAAAPVVVISDNGQPFDLVSVDIVAHNGSAKFDNSGFGGGCGADFNPATVPSTEFFPPGCQGITGFRMFAPFFQNSTIDNLVIRVASANPPPGSSEDNPILPDQTGEDQECILACPGSPFKPTRTCFCLNNASGQAGMFFGQPAYAAWIDPPMASGYIYEMISDSQFLGVADFPTGFNSPFTVSVNGTSLGQFGPGDFVSFGSGVSRFSVSGINPLVDAEDPIAFPLNVVFDTPTASLSMRAFLQVSIDIKPGSDDNSINLKSNGVIPVALLTNGFDATMVDPLSVRFGRDSAVEAHGKGHIEDADGDGDNDMVLHFHTQETGIQCGDTEVGLTGETVEGLRIEGADSITVKCK